jgi:hypothetical protein
MKRDNAQYWLKALNSYSLSLRESEARGVPRKMNLSPLCRSGKSFPQGVNNSAESAPPIS